jgi:hypothetical protein
LNKLPLVTPREAAEEIRTNLDPKKVSGFDFIPGEILKKFKRNAMVKLTTLINACIRLNYIPKAWTIAVVIMITKPGKNQGYVELYRAISLLPILSKLLEKLIPKRFKPIIEEKYLVPTHKFASEEITRQ